MAESSAFPWLKHLPEDAQREFFEELSEAFGEAQLKTTPGVLTNPDAYVRHLDPLLSAWKATAEVHSDPVLYAALTAEHRPEDFVEVERPEQCPSNTPDDRADDTAHWCVLAPDHAGLHTSKDGFQWTDSDAEARNPGRKPLACGWCFEEQGEEVHPHPECPVGVDSVKTTDHDAFDDVLVHGRSMEEIRGDLAALYGGDWSEYTVMRTGVDSVKAEVPGQRGAGVDRVKADLKQCGAGLPFEDGDEGWGWCMLSHPHHGHLHKDKTGRQWVDGVEVEVTTVESVRASTHHTHDFVGDEDYCTRGCMMTWSESRSVREEWERRNGLA